MPCVCSVLTLSQLVEVLVTTGKVEGSTRDQVLQFVADNKFDSQDSSQGDGAAVPRIPVTVSFLSCVKEN